MVYGQFTDRLKSIEIWRIAQKMQWSQCLSEHLFGQFNPIFCHKAHIVCSSRYKATNFQINCHKTIVQTQNMHIRIFWLLKNEEKTKTNFVYLNNTYYTNGKKKLRKKNIFVFINIERAFTASPLPFLMIMCTSLPINSAKNRSFELNLQFFLNVDVLLFNFKLFFFYSYFICHIKAMQVVENEILKRHHFSLIDMKK